MFKILLLSVCYMVATYLSTALLEHFSPLFMIGVRSLISGLFLLSFHFAYEKDVKMNLIKYQKQYFYAIFFGFIAPLVLSNTVLNHLPSVDTTAIYTSEPIITYLLAAYFFGERLNKKQVWYLILGSIFAFSSVFLEARFEKVSFLSLQDLSVLLITTIIAIGWLAIWKITDLEEPEDALVGAGFTSAGITAIAMSFYLETIKFSTNFDHILLFLIMIFFGDLIVTRMRVKLSKKYSTTLISLICIFIPFITALQEQLFHHQHYSYKFFLLIIPSLACFAAFYFEEVKNLN
jgi:drug/metabolite transporter (DMT)-like permease